MSYVCKVAFLILCFSLFNNQGNCNDVIPSGSHTVEGIVPAYNQDFFNSDCEGDCFPTAIGMILGYWDSQGWPAMIPGGGGEYLNNPRNVEWMVEYLSEAVGYTCDSGIRNIQKMTSLDNIGNYILSRNPHSNFTLTMAEYVPFDKIKSEIDADRPIMLTAKDNFDYIFLANGDEVEVNIGLLEGHEFVVFGYNESKLSPNSESEKWLIGHLGWDSYASSFVAIDYTSLLDLVITTFVPGGTPDEEDDDIYEDNDLLSGSFDDSDNQVINIDQFSETLVLSDFDFFYGNFDNNSTYRIELLTPPNTPLAMRIYDSNFNEIFSNNTNGAEGGIFNFSPTTNGWHALEISLQDDETNSYTASTNYYLSIHKNETSPAVYFDLEIENTSPEGGGVISSPLGINCGDICSASFKENTTVRLSANPASGYDFTGWSGSGCSGTGTCETVMEEDITITASFSTDVKKLSINVQGDGNVHISPQNFDCTSDCLIELGTDSPIIVTVEGTPSTTFSGWTGNDCGSINPCEMTIEADTSITATFESTQSPWYKVTVDLFGTGTGTVISDNGDINCGDNCKDYYEENSVITLQAIENSQSEFRGWGGACTSFGRSDTCTITVSEMLNVKASFSLTSDTACYDWEWQAVNDVDENFNFFFDYSRFGPYCANNYDWHVSDIDNDGYREHYMLTGETYVFWTKAASRESTGSTISKVMINGEDWGCRDGECNDESEQASYPIDFFTPSSTIAFPKVEWWSASPNHDTYSDYSMIWNEGILRECWDNNFNGIACDNGDHVENYVVVNCGVDADCNDAYKCSKPDLSEVESYTCVPKEQVSKPQFSIPAGVYSTYQYVTISSNTPDANIRYTRDGSTPTPTHGMPYYGAALKIFENTTLKAVAYKDRYLDSDVGSANYQIDQLPTPVFTPDGGQYDTYQTVSIESSVADTAITIYYTIDGSTPSSTNGTVYSGPIEIRRSSEMKAVAVGFNGIDSEVKTANYTLSMPSLTGWTINPPGGTYNSIQFVSVSHDINDAQIRYTTDGSDPTYTSGTLYSDPIEINRDTDLKIVAYKEGYADSEVESVLYEITDIPSVAPPLFSEASGILPAPTSVTLTSSTAGAAIHYTTDGSTPDRLNGILYESPIAIAKSTPLKAFAYKQGMGDSDITAADYTIIVPPPTITPGSGEYGNPLQVTLSSEIAGSTIRYTLGGTQLPRVGRGTVYEGPFAIDLEQVNSLPIQLDAIAFTNADDVSTVSTASFYITERVIEPVFNPAGGTYQAVKFVEISSDTPDAVIRYTTDGSSPSTSHGTIYNEPVEIGHDQVLKAIAYRDDLYESVVVSENYLFDFPNVMSPPEITNGYFFAPGPVYITIQCEDPNATIYYTDDGSVPSDSNGKIYSGSIQCSETTTFKALCHRDGYEPSSVTTGEVGFVVVDTIPTPEFDPPAGTYDSIQDVSITSAPGTQILYSTSSAPLPPNFGKPYSGTPVTVDKYTNLRAVAYEYLEEYDLYNYTWGTALYVINLQKVSDPLASLESGTYGSTLTVSLATATDNATIRYTTDGSEPTETHGLLYSQPLEITSSTTVKAIAYKSGMLSSNVVTTDYTILQTSPPVFSKKPGEYGSILEVAINSATADAVIRYTLDGSTPTRSSGIVYSGPVEIAATTTLKAIAYKDGFLESGVVSSKYSILRVNSPTFTPESGIYNYAVTVLVDSATVEAEIRYTVDGSTPTRTHGVLYDGPIYIASPTTLKAIAYKDSILDSAVNSNNYIIEISMGDINGDGTLTLLDSIIPLIIATGGTPELPSFVAADANGDDKIGIEDAIYVLKELSEQSLETN